MSGLWDLIALKAPNESIRNKATIAGGILGGGPSVGATMTPPALGNNQWEPYAQNMAMTQYGYSPEEWNALDSIIERESGWNPNAVNDSSGAYGIPQILPSAHPDANLQNDPLGQLQWLFKYIQGRYGGPLQALDFKNANNWY
jgi:hypothetical protein